MHKYKAGAISRHEFYLLDMILVLIDRQIGNVIDDLILQANNITSKEWYITRSYRYIGKYISIH